MAWIKRGSLVVLLIAAGFLAWSYLFGPLKVRGQIREFAAAMDSCTPLDQAAISLRGGDPQPRSVEGVADGACNVRMQTLGPQDLLCAFPMGEMPVLAESFATQADVIGFFGGTRLQIDTDTADPFTQALNSDACNLVDR